MKKILYVLIGLIVLLVAAVFVLPGAIDWRPRIVAAIHEATGRDARIDGPLRISLLPTLSVSASDIHLANPPGGTASDMVSIGSVSLQAEVWPLLHGRLVVNRLDIAKPIVNLSVDKAGKPNWLLTPPGKPKPAKPASNGSGMTVELRSVHLDQGHLTYADAVTGQTIDTTDITLTGGTAGGAGKLVWQLGLTMNKEPITGAFSIDSTEKLLAGQPADIIMSLKAKHLTASYKGTAQQAPAPGLNGTFDLDIPSVGALFAWLKQPLTADPGPLNLHLETVSSGGKLELRRAALTGRAITMTAQASIDATKTPPSFDAKIDIPKANLDSYMPPPPPPSHPAPPGPPPAAAETGWSTAPYDFSILGAVDGHLVVTVAALRYHGLDITQANFDATLGKKVLRLTKADLRLAGGTIASTLTLDANAPAAKLAATLDISGVQARPLLSTLAGSDRLGGAIALSTAVTATGANQKQMVDTLAGTGKLRITDGAIYGINLAQSLRKMGTLGLGDVSTEKTDFAELGGSYTISKGVLSNPDLSMLAPLLRLSGNGTVALPPRTLSYAIEAKLVASLHGQGGSDALAGVPIPIRINGPWTALDYGVDWSGALRSLALDPSKLRTLPNDLGKVAPDVQKLVPGLKLPGGLFGK